jgi:hypothetical protein
VDVEHHVRVQHNVAHNPAGRPTPAVSHACCSHAHQSSSTGRPHSHAMVNCEAQSITCARNVCLYALFVLQFCVTCTVDDLFSVYKWIRLCVESAAARVQIAGAVCVRAVQKVMPLCKRVRKES